MYDLIEGAANEEIRILSRNSPLRSGVEYGWLFVLRHHSFVNLACSSAYRQRSGCRTCCHYNSRVFLLSFSIEFALKLPMKKHFIFFRAHCFTDGLRASYSDQDMKCMDTWRFSVGYAYYSRFLRGRRKFD